MKKKVLIFGGTGFIGSKLANLFKVKGFDTTVADINTNYLINNSFSGYVHRILEYRYQTYLRDISIHRVDAKNKFEVYDIIKSVNPNIIINLAALPLANLSNTFSEETNSSIIGTSLNIIESIRRINTNIRFCYFSSSMVYGNFIKSKVDENHPTNPISVYGSVKLAGEVLIKGLCNKFAINYTIIRPSAVYGPTDTNSRVIQNFFHNAFIEKPIIVKGINTKLDFTHVDDLSMGVFMACTKSKGINNIFNITRSEGKSLKTIINFIKENFENTKIIIEGKDLTIPKRGALNIDKARNALNYKPKISLEDGMTTYYEFLKNNIYDKK